MADDIAPELEKGEKLRREIRSDKRIFWRDHLWMALIGMALVALVLWLMDNAFILIGTFGAGAAVAVRALYLASEALASRWWLTDRRVILPDGKRAVMLLEIETVRRLFGDVQIVTRAGDKYLIKHLADGDALVAEITAARDRRRKVAR
ncbi:hypothetical protein [Alkalilacustris brevis]|uniref:hypothetical protein n=1 Tax=Alkalilacustris brevis TaxID=2026338 RepID=UPI000E0D0E0C|nr:hypothetical protein [Alkalilacustris brevis]